MKKIACLSVLMFVAFSGLCSAQPVPGKKYELSTSATLWGYKSESGGSFTVVSVPFRLGIALFRGLAVEPEAFLTFSSASYGSESDSSIGMLGLLNLTYSFGSGQKTIPFLLAGIGYGNGGEILNIVSDSKTGILALNAGLGARFMVTDTAAIRLEYRFIRYSGEKKGTYYDLDYDLSMHKIMVGISIFL